MTSTLVVAPEPPPPGATTQPYVVVAPEPAPPVLDQPPGVKLLLGHYANSRRGIGAVIDRTQKEAKLRFDGTDQILRAYPAHGGRGRIDYMRNVSSILFHLYEGGHVVVYVPGATSEGIPLYRDGDAEPL